MSKSIFKHLLNQYFEGKDNNIPAVIESIFSEQAVVTFDIDTDVIEFPAKIVGAKTIAEEMFASFHDDFEKVRSYYVIEPDAASAANCWFSSWCTYQPLTWGPCCYTWRNNWHGSSCQHAQQNDDEHNRYLMLWNISDFIWFKCFVLLTFKVPWTSITVTPVFFTSQNDDSVFRPRDTEG